MKMRYIVMLVLALAVALLVIAQWQLSGPPHFAPVSSPHR